MRRPDTLGKTLLWALLLFAAGPLPAAVLRAEVDAVRSGVGSLEQVEVRLAWAPDATEGMLELRAGTLDFPLLSYRASDVVWSCPLRRAAAGEWTCAGPLQVRGAPAPASLSLAISPAEAHADLVRGEQRISYRNLAAAPDLSRIRVEQIPVAWLKAYLAALWAEGQWTQGRLSGQIDITAAADGPFQVATDLQLSGLGLETPDGWLAAAGLGGRLKLDYVERGPDTRISTTFEARGGEFLAQGLYALLPDSPVIVQVEASRRGQAPWRLPRLAWTDGQVLRAEGQAQLGAQGSVQDLDLDLRLGDLAVARDRYLSGFLAPAGFGDLVLSGGADATLQLRAGELQAMALDLEGVTAIDPRQRFILAGLRGGLRWTHAAEAVASQLRWDSGALYGIGVGPARFDFDSAGGELRLREPTALAMLEGQARLDQFRWQAPRTGQGTRFQIGATLTDLDLGSLSQRLGWPPFTGSLGGRIPSARYEGGVLTLDGGLTMQVFGGSVALSELVMERPFGIAPTLSADIVIEDIDMEPMTAAFGFGAITGRMDGRIAKLRMVDWSPVAFDARLLTDPAWKGRRRISQRAVEDISRVGGAGLVAGLQTQALRLFDDFGYARIGLGCRLRDNVCDMAGVGSAGDGYTIVEGSGLPRIQVVGFRRRVDWPTLVDRLEAATAGQAPVIQ